MRCPSCKTNHKASAGMTCQCGYKFVFNPKTDGITDNKFQVCLNRASGNDTYFFTENQLYAAYCRLVMARPWRLLLIAAVVLAASLFLAKMLDDTSLAAWEAAVTVVLVLIDLYRRFRAPPSFRDFAANAARWRGGGRSLKRLIRKPKLGKPPPKWKEKDIYDYGVERILIVERDVLVDLLVKNHFHEEQRCLVVAESGYPEYLLEPAQRLLTEDPELPVYLLHDATYDGVTLEDRLRRSERFPIADHPVIDLGLSPESIGRIPRLHFARRRQEGVPVDFLLYGFLSSGLGLAVVEGLSFEQLLLQKSHDDTFSFG